ncbi:MAG: hypothetical protein WBG32_18050 [Nodosilinea sp.]
MTGRDPGELGIYGFRNRRDRDYHSMAISGGRAVNFPRLWDNLAWRSVGSVGINSLYTVENDTSPDDTSPDDASPDDANHAPLGLMIFYDPKAPQGGQVLEGAQIYDLVPTRLHRYGIDAPAKLRGKILAI